MKASLKKYPEIGLKFCAIIIAISGFYFAKTLNQRDSESMFIIESIMFVSLCFYVLYLIAATIKLFKNDEKYFNTGFNLSIVLTFLLLLISFAGGLAYSPWNNSVVALFLMFSLPVVIPVFLLSISIPSRGNKAKNRFFFGVLLSIPFCILSTLYSGLTFMFFVYHRLQF